MSASNKAINSFAKGMNLKLLGDFFRPLAIGAAASAGMGFLAYRQSKEEEAQAKKEVQDSFLSLKELPPFKKDPESFSQRFQELAFLSPTLAKNPAMAAKVLEKKQKSGFSLDDVHKLTSIQTALPAITAAKAPPSAKAKAVAMGTFDRLVNSFGPVLAGNYLSSADFTQRAIDSAKTRFKQHEDRITEELKMQKQSSTKVSEECAAVMLADRYSMLKTAAVSSRAAAGLLDKLKSGGKNFGEGLAYFAAPMALIGLAHGIGALIDKKKVEAAEKQALEAFNKIKKDSVAIQENPALAQEAFDAMKSFAPSLAVKPQILKTFIEHTIQTERIPVETARGLADTQVSINKTSPKGFAAGLFEAAAPLSGMKDIQKAVAGDSRGKSHYFGSGK